MLQHLRTSALAALVGGGVAGPACAGAALIARALLGEWANGSDILIETSALFGFGAFFGIVAAMVVGFPILAALSMAGYRGVGVHTAVGAVVAVLALRYLVGTPCSVGMVAMISAIGALCGAIGAIYTHRSNMPVHRTAHGGR